MIKATSIAISNCADSSIVLFNNNGRNASRWSDGNIILISLPYSKESNIGTILSLINTVVPPSLVGSATTDLAIGGRIYGRGYIAPTGKSIADPSWSSTI